MRQLLVLLSGLVDAMAAWILAGTGPMLVVLAAGGWAVCQHDDHYQRARTMARTGS